MKTFDKSLLQKKIIMISDYIDPSKYSPGEMDKEKEFIEIFMEQINKHTNNFEYVEFKTSRELEEYLKKHNNKEVVIFNWCEEIDNLPDSMHLVTQLLEQHGFIFTGADTRCLILGFDKAATKKALLAHNINTPKYKLINDGSELTGVGLAFPLIVKLGNTHCSMGLTNENIVHDQDQLNKIGQRMFEQYNVPLMIEEFISGDEYTIPVWGNGPEAHMIGFCKIDYQDKDKIYIQTADSKNLSDSEDFKNTPYKFVDKKEQDFLKKIISNNIINAYNILGYKDYGRFEIRIKGDKYYLIDANPNPALFDHALLDATALEGFNYGETILKICEYAVTRSEFM